MSDPVTNVEIEDVLSSIRRLVSEDSRSESMSGAPVAPRSVVPGRLVLTPALRVQDGPSGRADAAEPEVSEQEAERHAAPVAARLIPSEEEIAETARHTPIEALLPEDDGEEAPFIEVEESAESEPVEASIADFFALKPREVTSASQRATEAAPKEGSLARKIAELEEMIARSTHEFEPERGEEAPAAIFRHQPVTQDEVPAAGAAPVVEAPLVAAEDHDPELASRPMPEPELVDEPYSLEGFAVEAAEPVEDEVEVELAVETLEEAFEDEGEDDEIGAERAELVQPDLRDELEAAELEAEPAPAPVRRPVKILRNPVWQRSQSNLRSDAPARTEAPAPAASEAPAADALPAGLDEERLRALVAEVIREELQGALGERVTRNVRKLVRRELQRLLSSEDLD